MTDAHCHPRDLLGFLKNAEEERLETGTACAGNAWNPEQFEYIENLSRNANETGSPRLIRCFALHPQLSAVDDFSPRPGLELLYALAAEGRVEAVGETGFDLYDERFRAGEKVQDELFACHLETAVIYGLPMILHVRRAMHKIFPFAGEFKKLPALIFHSWPGTPGEGEALLRRGINAFFSFSAAVINNHRKAMACAAAFPEDRLLLETDAPFQPPRGKTYSCWRDLDLICGGIAALRKKAGSSCDSFEELETVTTANFFRAFTGRELF